MSKTWTLDPPVNDDKFQQIYNAIKSEIPLYEIPTLLYFQTCWHSLLEYAMVHEHQHQNFSLSIGFFVPNFDYETDGHHLFTKENQWVKVIVTGGMGSAFRSCYMATQAGITEIDWKSSTARFSKKASMFVGTKVIAKAVEVSVGPIAGFVTDVAGDKVSERSSEKSHHRRESRLHHRIFTVQQMLNLTRNLPLDVLQAKKASGEINDYKQCMLDALKEHESDGIDLNKFMEFTAGCWTDEGRVKYFREHSVNEKMAHMEFAGIFIAMLEYRAKRLPPATK